MPKFFIKNEQINNNKININDDGINYEIIVNAK